VMVETKDEIIQQLVERCRGDFRRWINGDGRGYELPDDGTIFGPFGGAAMSGGAAFAEMQRKASEAYWLSGEGDIELLTAGVSGDIAWLVYIERAQASFAGQDGLRRWELRVTDLFRRTDDGWERFHIHEDACVDTRRPDELIGDLS
jgi:ketosteroid isomerase-like protein